MSFQSAFNTEENEIAEINMTPLVDVMLVLLIIFMVTLPVIQHAVKLELPQASNQANPVKPEQIQLAIDLDGIVHWQSQAVTQTELVALMSQAAGHEPLPELHLRADKKVAYEAVAQVISLAQNNGLRKIAFVTAPYSPAK
ncbi:ExbD/TolR family protein [Parvibium lacunae]|uniref:Biopolymer transporter ExbD n=1 Tax=Parvibium lacunae TaxID=1888893 RepID=A0A368L469_9BURK|nr:biopolymer transporter ExbD [Parvibium lacunae]RCS58378.1 biopolymer transporter ExbD [Parvibium lacunae]